MSTSTQDETNSSPESRPKRNLRQTTLLDYRSQTDRSPPLPIAPQPSLNNGVVATNAIASPADGAADSEASDLDNAPQPPHKKRKLRSATRSEAVESGEKGMLSEVAHQGLELTSIQTLQHSLSRRRYTCHQLSCLS